MSMNLVTLLYLVASVCFIQALKGLSHPTTSIRGNVFGMTGMAIAVLTTAALIVQLAGSAAGLGYVLLGLVIGEKLMGIPGMILAPVILHFVKVEVSRNKFTPQTPPAF
jgi:NAD/NADP transhydrogenase beta subunit